MKHEDDVVKEFPKVGKYRVRLLRMKQGLALDIREWVETPKFTGFSRRGIRIIDITGIDELFDSLKEVRKLWWEEQKKEVTS